MIPIHLVQVYNEKTSGTKYLANTFSFLNIELMNKFVQECERNHKEYKIINSNIIENQQQLAVVIDYEFGRKSM